MILDHENERKPIQSLALTPLSARLLGHGTIAPLDRSRTCGILFIYNILQWITDPKNYRFREDFVPFLAN